MDLRSRTTPYTDAEIKVISLFIKDIIECLLCDSDDSLLSISLIILWFVSYGYHWHFPLMLFDRVGLAPLLLLK